MMLMSSCPVGPWRMPSPAPAPVRSRVCPAAGAGSVHHRMEAPGRPAIGKANLEAAALTSEQLMLDDADAVGHSATTTYSAGAALSFPARRKSHPETKHRPRTDGGRPPVHCPARSSHRGGVRQEGGCYEEWAQMRSWSDESRFTVHTASEVLFAFQDGEQVR